MSKFYAVRIGKIPGIYSDWDSCKNQIYKYPGAVYKSFVKKDDALKFLEVNKLIENTSEIHIYTDGSHQKLTNYIGIGSYCKYKDVEYSLSLECNDNMLKTYNIDCQSYSNPTCELLGFSETLKLFQNVKFKEPTTLVFHIDYIGVKCWIEGIWKANEHYIKTIRDYCLDLIKILDCKVIIHHIKGHSGIEQNDKRSFLGFNARVGNCLLISNF